MILGYASEFGVLPGDNLELHFSAPANGTRARIHFYRWGMIGAGPNVGWNHLTATNTVVLDQSPRGTFNTDWGWPFISWPVPQNWRSGAYVAIALGENEDGKQVDPETRRLEQVLFVVKSPSPGKNTCILYKLPFFTYAAYNGAVLGSQESSTSLYDIGGPHTMHRPGIGADPWDTGYQDWEDNTSPRQTFAHWDGKMIGWLERTGYNADFCTDLDIHRDATLVSNYRLLLSVGHDEYWSEAMRNNVEAYIKSGGNVAFFSGNTSWWRTQISENAGDILIERLDNWPTNNLETHLTGVSYRHGNGKWSGGRREGVGYTVQNTGHWVFANVTLTGGNPVGDGDVFGADERLVGYECDGTALAPEVIGQPRVPSFIDGTPSSFIVLGVGATPWWDGESYYDRVATMGAYVNGGTVFTAATTDWPRVLAAGHPTVQQITKNVLDCLCKPPLEIRGPVVSGACNPNLVAVGGVASFFVANAPFGAAYKWTVTGGGTIVGSDTNSKVKVQMPATQQLVIISVTVTGPGNLWVGSATKSFMPVTLDDYLVAQLICRLRHFVIGLARSRKAIEGVGPDSKFFVDPLWDPIRGEHFSFRENDLRRLQGEAHALVEELNRAIGRLGRGE